MLLSRDTPVGLCNGVLYAFEYVKYRAYVLVKGAHGFHTRALWMICKRVSSTQISGL